MKISVILEALTGGFETDMERARKASEKAFAQMKKDAQASNVAIGRVLTGGLVLGAAGAVGLGVAVKSAVNEMDKLSKTAQKVGVTTEALSALQYAAELADVDIGQLQGGMTRLVKAQAEVAAGTEKQTELFKSLGVEVLNADGSLRNADDVMADLADQFANMEDGATKTALAVQIFGRAGADLIPLLNGGAQGFRNAANEAKAFGLIVSTEAGQAAEQFNDNITRMGKAMQGAGIQLATDLLPVMNELSDRVVGMAKDPAFQNELADAVRTIGEVAIDAAQGIVTMTNVLKFLYDEARQLVGVVDADDLVRQYEELASKREQLRRQEAGHIAGDEAPMTIRLRAEVKAIEENIAAQEKLLNTRARIDTELQPIDMSGIPARKRAPASGEVFAGGGGGAAQKGTGYRDAMMAQADEAMRELEDAYREQQMLFEDVQRIKFRLMDEEAQAVQMLQAEYTTLQNAIAAGAITAEEGASVAADLARQWAEEQQAYHQQALDWLSAGLLTEEEEIQRSYERRREAILEEMALTEQEKTDLLVRAEQQRKDQLEILEQERQMMVVSSAASIADSLASITKDSLGEQSKAYRVMFAISKGFAVAEAAVAMAQNIANASKIGFPQNLPMIAGAVAQGAQIAAILSGANYSGAYDRGGSIPAGSYGLVGERGPELVAGPASVTGRLQTASMMQRAGGSETKVRIISITDSQNVADYLSSDPGEQNLIAFANKNRGFFKQLVS
jgi:hypothetical protein